MIPDNQWQAVKRKTQFIDYNETNNRIEINQTTKVNASMSVGGGLTVTGNIIPNSSQSVKKIYWHTIKFQRGGTGEQSTVSRIIGYMIILNNSPEPITSDNFLNLLSVEGFIGVVINGKGSPSGASNLQNMTTLVRIEYQSATICNAVLRDDTTNLESDLAITIGTGWVTVTDLGANPIN